MNEQKSYYEQQISSLEEENKRLLDTLIRHSKTKASGAHTPSANNTQVFNQSSKENMGGFTHL
jgi:hypothetical protein